jgi:hypothetical protein
LVLLLGLVAACGSSARSPGSLIVLDRSIGGVSLKEHRSDIESTVGRGVFVMRDQIHGDVIGYPKVGLEVFYAPGPDRREIAIEVFATSARYRTSHGVHVGSSLSEVKSIEGVQCAGPDECQHGYSVHGAGGTTFQLRAFRVWRIALALGH